MKVSMAQVLPPFLLIAFIAISFNCSCLADSTNDSAAATRTESGGGNEEKEPFNKTLFFAFLEEDPNAVNSVGYEILKDKPVFKDIIVPHNANERKFRPMLQWRAWADKPQSFLPGLLFLTMISFFFWWLMPRKLQNATAECRTNFWKSFGAGALLSLISIIVTRSIFLTEIGWPLGIALAAFFQGAMLAGLALVIYLLGHSVNRLIKIHTISFFSSREGALLACDLIVGSLLSALILLIPNVGEIPRIGPRLLALFAILGIGALYRQSRSNSEN